MPNVESHPNSVPFTSMRKLAGKPVRTGPCEMCSSKLPEDHQHLMDLKSRKLICSCDACATLFSGLSSARFKRVPRCVRFLRGLQIPDAHWNSLMIPIETAFIFRSSSRKGMVAFYPGPVGATESLLSLETWKEIEQENPVLVEIEPDVAALVVNRLGMARGMAPEYYVAPIDECYKLVGLIRTHWRGQSGGTGVWREVSKFFAYLKTRSGLNHRELHT